MRTAENEQVMAVWLSAAARGTVPVSDAERAQQIDRIEVEMAYHCPGNPCTPHLLLGVQARRHA